MMRSTFNDGNNDDDDFAPNPFRDSSGGTDFFSTPTTPQPTYVVQQQQQQPYGMQQQQYNPGMQQQQQFPMQQQPQFMQQPDPNSGMMGNYNPNMMMMQQQPPPMDPVHYLSGPMDQGAAAYPDRNQIPQSQQPAGAAQPPPSMFSWRGILACCHMDNATKLFDVDTIDVYLRIKAALTKFHLPDYFRLTVVGDIQAQQAANAGTVSPADAAAIPIADRKGPDLYGPVWISFTLMFVLGMTANLSAYVRHVHSKKGSETADQEFEYDLTHLFNATYICFGYTFGVPTMFWLACQCLGMASVSWSTWICVYGYSLSPILFGAMVAWWFAWSLWHWIVLAVAVAASGMLLVRNLSTPLLSQDIESAHAKAAPLLLSMLGAQFIFLLVLKITFYP